jgi:hypothetical protein
MLRKSTVTGKWNAILGEVHYHRGERSDKATWTAVRDSMSQAMAAAQADYDKRFAS